MFTENWDDPESAPVPVEQVLAQLSNKSSQRRDEDFKQYTNEAGNQYSWRDKCITGDRLQATKQPGSNVFNWKKHGRSSTADSCSSSWRRNSNSENSETHMKVESSKVGRIIGKKGSKIKELQKITETKIQIGEEDNYFKEVTISGSEDGQKECQKLIEQLLTDRPVKVEYGPVKENVPVIDWDALNAMADKMESEKWAKCPPLKKDFYTEHPDVANMSMEEVEAFRQTNNNIVVKNAFGGNEKVLNPVKTFEQAFQHYPEILKQIEKQNFEKPSPIQSQAWPILLSGKDLIGIAQTGTGKTLAFLLPALIHIDGQSIPRSKRGGANVLIMAPTRELALQIEKEVQKYSYKGIQSVCVYGGGDRRQQMKVVIKGVEIIIATPGRLNDLVEAKVINLSSITYVVLDEADRMLDMGFEPQIRKVLLDIRPDRQSVMTSATWPHKVQALAERYMCKPVQVYIGSLDLAAVHSVTQTVLVVRSDEKKDYLLDFIYNLSKDDKVIIFVSRKVNADNLSCDLSLEHILCQCIHGGRAQIDREQALDDLKTGTVKILVATDVASRGIDISDVTKVFNYDFPKNIEEYVHRVGRTGRAGKDGEAVSLFTRADCALAGELITIMEEANQPVPEELYKMKERFLSEKQYREEGGRKTFGFGRGGGGGGGGGRRFDSDFY